MNIRFSDALLALLVHGLLAVMLLVGVQCSRQVKPPGVIQGVLIPAQSLRTAPSSKAPPAPLQPAAPVNAPKSTVAQEETHQNAADIVAKQRQEAAAAQRAMIEQQRAQEKAKAESLLAQQKAKADAAAKLKAQEEAKRAAEQAVARKQAEEEKRRQALAEQKKADADRKAKAAAAAAAAKAAAERRLAQEQLQGALASELQGEAVNQWGAQVIAAITRAWSYIAGSDQLHCKIRIQLAPSGEVQDVRVTTPSGNELFDQSAVRAAYKASPLPVPSDPLVFQSIINVCFSPGGSRCQ
jgi:colicin import membrane protein